MNSKIKIILAFILGITISVFISVTATTMIYSKDVFYDNTKTGLTANVNDAIDETYTKAENLSVGITNLQTRVTSLEDTTSNYVKAIQFTKSDVILEPNADTWVEIPVTVPDGYKYVALVNMPTYSNNIYTIASEGYSATRGTFKLKYRNISSSQITFNARVVLLFIKDV